jgi:flagellar basal body-associated protein FliL
MKKSKLNALVDIIMFIVLLISTFSGIILWLVLPSGTEAHG